MKKDQPAKQKAAQIRLLVLDVDGVLTDGRLIYGDDGQEYKAFHSRDGLGMRMLMDSGVEIAILTGRTSKVVSHRCNNLGVRHVYQGFRDKRPVFEDLVKKLGLSLEQTAYMGDDLVDLPVMRQAGLALAVADAHDYVKDHSHWTSHHKGGRGAVREACEMIMDAQGSLPAMLERFLE